MTSVRAWKTNSRSWVGANTGSIQLHDPSVAPNGVVYQFQDDILDSSGNGRNLSLATGTERYTYIVPGVLAFDFDSFTRLVFSTTGTALQETGAISAGMIINFIQVSIIGGSSRLNTIWNYAADTEAEEGNGLHGLLFDENVNMQWFQESGNGDNRVYNINNLPPFARVCHYGVTRTAGNVVQNYLNGIPFGAPGSPPASATDGSTAFLNIGGAPNDDFFFRGNIASFFIEPGTAFSASEMLALANATIGLYYGIIT